MSARTVHSSRPALHGLVRKVDNHTVFAGQYNVSVKNGKVTVIDKKNRSNVVISSGTDISTSDGDKARFEDGNLTLTLRDGAKVTVVAGPKDASGKATIDKVVITRGHEGMTISDVGTKPRISHRTERGRALDQNTPDGSVLKPRGSIADLVNTQTKQEIKGDTTATPPAPPASTAPAASESNTPAGNPPPAQTQNNPSSTTPGDVGGANGKTGSDPQDLSNRQQQFDSEMDQTRAEHNEYMRQQRQLNAESERYAAQSNMARTRHDTLMALIANFKG